MFVFVLIGRHLTLHIILFYNRMVNLSNCCITSGEAGGQGTPGLPGAPGPQGFRGDSGDPGSKGKAYVYFIDHF